MKIVKQLLFLSISSLLLCLLYHNSLARNLNQIPEKERKYLESFFRESFSHEGLGYTLFGDKPITAVVYYDPQQMRKEMIENLFCSLHPENIRMWQGSAILEKYKNFFTSHKIAIVRAKNFIDNGCECILFVNKKLLLEIVENHLNDFQSILGKGITPQLVLERVLNSEDVFRDALQNHQGLIGTLLGYGRENAWLFHQREEHYLFTEGSFLLAKRPFCLKSVNMARIETHMQPFDERDVLDFNPLLLSLPAFMADCSAPETKNLKSKYEQQYREILHRYKDKDFLETTLQAFI